MDKETKVKRDMLKRLGPYIREVRDALDALEKRMDHEVRQAGTSRTGLFCNAHNIRGCDVCMDVHIRKVLG